MPSCIITLTIPSMLKAYPCFHPGSRIKYGATANVPLKWNALFDEPFWAVFAFVSIYLLLSSASFRD
jgi:hypothetical protein